MNAIKTIAAATLVAATSTPALAAVAGHYPGTNFSGTDRNWFNPANWSTGRVPGPDDSVILDGNDDVVIDPALAGRSGGNVELSSLTLKDDARLEALQGTRIRHRMFAIVDRSQMTTRSSVVEVDELVAFSQTPCLNCGIKLNPSGWYVTKPVVIAGTSMYFGLGGREPVGITKTGAGTVVFAGYGAYATLNADTLVLGEGPGTTGYQLAARVRQLRQLPAESNATPPAQRITARIDKLPSQVTARIDRLPRLQVALHYGFEPAAGDRFQIITANTLLGEFDGLPEGALVGCTEEDVGLTISYRGGDGNDVVLSASDTSPDACATKEHILLARQVGVPG